ncbi:hypothetical protein MASR1M45_00700 [Candidatus Kapaibacterium sp.]
MHIYVLLILLSVLSFVASFSRSDTLVLYQGDSFIRDVYVDFNNRGYHYYQDYLSVSDPKDDYSLLVNTSNGNLYYSRTDYYRKDIGLPINIQFTYNSGSSYFGRYGNFWQFFYAPRLVSNNINKHKIFVYPDDRTQLFKYDSLTKTYTSPKNFRDSLWQSERGELIILVYNQQALHNLGSKCYYYFKGSSSHFPFKILDEFGNETLLSYFEDMKLKSITFTGGSIVHLEYDNEMLVKIILPGGKDINYFYDAQGNLISVQSASGKQINYLYDDCGHLTKIINDRREIQFSYDSDFRVNKVINYYPELTYNISYDTTNKFTNVTMPDKSIFYYKYDNLLRSIEKGVNNTPLLTQNWDVYNNLIMRKDLFGTYRYNYDKKNRLNEVIYPDNVRSIFEWDDVNKLLRKNFRSSTITEFYFDRFGKIKTYHSAGKNPISFNRDLNGIITDITIGNSINVNLLIDNLGNYKKINIDGINHLSLNYDFEGNISEISDFYGNTYGFSYDDYKRIVNIKYPDLTEKSVYYDDSNFEAIFAKRNGSTIKYKYDRIDRLSEIIDELGSKISLKFNYKNLIITKLDKVWNINFDNNFLPLSIVYPDNNKLSINYLSDKISELQFNIRKIQFNYNNLGLLVNFIDANGNTTKYDYNQNFDVSEIQYGNNLLKKYVYDYSSNKIEKSLGALNFRITYDPDGNITSKELNNRKLVTNLYDKYGILKNSKSDTTIDYVHDQAGRLSKKIVNYDTEFLYGYNLSNQIIEIKSSTGQNFRFTYKNGDNISQIEINNNSLAINYDSKGRVTGIIDAMNLSKNYEWDNFNNITSFTDKNNAKHSFTLNSNEIKSINPSGAVTVYKIIKTLGNKFLNQVLNHANTKIDFQYDNNFNLTSITDANSSRIQISYDKLGNPLSILNSKGEQTLFTYDVTNRMVNVNRSDKLDKTFVYDFQSNVSDIYDYDKLRYSLSYNSNNKLIQVNSNGLKLSYNYNGKGQLSKYDLNDYYTIIYDYDNTGNISRIYNDKNDYFELTYTDNGLVKSKKNNLDIIYNYEYDKNNLLTSSSSNKSHELKIHYNESGLLTNLSLDKIELLNLKYNSFGSLISLKSPYKNINYIYNNLNLLQRSNLGNNPLEQYTYDYMGRLLSLRYADNSRETMVYNSIGELVEYKSSDLREFYYNYDANGYPKLIKWARNDSLITTFDNDGRLVSIIYPKGNSSTFLRDASGRITRMNILNSKLFSIKYNSDIFSNSIGFIINNNDTVTYLFDKSLRYRGVKGDQYLTKKYNSAGLQLSGFGLFIDEETLNNQFDYNKIININTKNEFVHFEYPENSYLPNKITLNNTDFIPEYQNGLKLKRLYTTEKLINQFTYNTNGFLIDYFSDSSHFIFNYNELNLLNDIKLNFDYNLGISYNNSKDIIKLHDNSNNIVEYIYDNKSNISKIQNSDSKHKYFLFDNNTNLIIYSNETFDESGYLYNNSDLLKSTIFPDLSSSINEYNDLFAVKTVDINEGDAFDYQYNYRHFNNFNYKVFNHQNEFTGQISYDDFALNYNSNILNKKIYDSLGRLIAVSIVGNGNLSIMGDKSLQDYELNGRKLLTSHKLNNNLTKYSIYKNNALESELSVITNNNKQITEVKEFGNSVIKITYDSYSRVTTLNNNTDNYSINYYNDGRIKTFTKNGIVRIFNYDQFNRLINDGNNHYEYDLRGNIDKIIGEVDTIFYSYDYDNRLTHKIVNFNDTTFVKYNHRGEIVKIISHKVSNYERANLNEKYYPYSELSFNQSGSLSSTYQSLKNFYSSVNYIQNFEDNILSFQVLSEDGTCLFSIDKSGDINLLINKLTPFGLSTTNQASLNQFKNMRYYEELGLYFDGTRFYDNRFGVYLQNKTFSIFNSSIPLATIKNESNYQDKSSFFAIPQDNFFPIINPFDNRFVNIKKELNPYSTIQAIINKHFNDFKVYDILLNNTYNNNLIMENEFDLSLRINDFLNYNSKAPFISPKFPEQLADTLLKLSNFSQLPEVLPKTPNGTGLDLIQKYLNLIEFSDDLIIKKLLTRILKVEEPFDEIEINNITYLRNSTQELDIIEFALNSENLTKDFIFQNMNYEGFRKSNVLELVKKYLPEIESNESEDNLIDITELVSYSAKPTDYSFDLASIIDSKSKIINTTISNNIRNILYDILETNPFYLIPGRSLYKDNLIELPFTLESPGYYPFRQFNKIKYKFNLNKKNN